MAVVEVTRKPEDSGTISLDNRYRATGERSITWQVLVSDPTADTVATVEASVLVVQPGNAHPDSIYYRCVNRTVKQTSPLLFEVDATYKTPEYDPGTSGTDSPNPLAVPALIRFGTYSSEEPIDEDANGNAIATATGELIEGITRQVSDQSITITKNFGSFIPQTFYLFIDTVNSDTFVGFPPGTVRCTGIDAIQQTQDDWIYWEVTVQFLARKPYRTSTEQAWYKRVRHAGYYEKKGSGSVRIREDKTQENPEPQLVVQPQLLSTSGIAIRPLGGGTPNWLTFQVYESRAFSAMGLL